MTSCMEEQGTMLRQVQVQRALLSEREGILLGSVWEPEAWRMTTWMMKTRLFTRWLALQI